MLATILLQLTSLQRVYDSYSNHLIRVVLLGAYAGTMGAILGLHALQRQSGRYGRPGAVGSLIAFIGYAMVSVLTAISAPQGGQALLEVRLTTGEGVLIGSVLLGVMTLSARGGAVVVWCADDRRLPPWRFLRRHRQGGEGVMLGILWGSVG